MRNLVKVIAMAAVPAMAILALPALSAAASPITATVPSATAAPTVSIGTGQAVVSWHNPLSNGGSPVTSYTVNAYATSFGQHTLLATVNSVHPPVTFTNGQLSGGAYNYGAGSGAVMEGTYAFTVTANNAVGAGPESAQSKGVNLTQKLTALPIQVSFPDSSYTRNESAYSPVSIRNAGNTSETVDVQGPGYFNTSGVWMFILNDWQYTLAPGQTLATSDGSLIWNVDISAQAVRSGHYATHVAIEDASGGSDLAPDGTVLYNVPVSVNISK